MVQLTTQSSCQFWPRTLATSPYQYAAVTPPALFRWRNFIKCTQGVQRSRIANPRQQLRDCIK